MTLEGALGELYRQELYTGTGCTSSLNFWRKEVKKRPEIENKRMKLPEPYSLDKYFQIFLHSLGRQFTSGEVFKLATMSFVSELQDRGMRAGDAQTLGNMVYKHIFEERTKSDKEFFGS